jgi:hypothetical protein
MLTPNNLEKQLTAHLLRPSVHRTVTRLKATLPREEESGKKC